MAERRPDKRFFGWQTEDEINFISNFPERNDPRNFKAFLTGYIKAAKQRINWLMVSQQECIYHAENLLAGLK